MTATNRPYDEAIQHLREAGIRPTRQRLALAKFLFDGTYKHVSAECLMKHACQHGLCLSLATVYNTLHQFTAAGLLRELVVESGKSWFDTRTEDHCHYFCEATGELMDIPESDDIILALPTPPQGRAFSRVDVIIRVDHSR